MVRAHRDERPALASREALPFLACALLGFGVLALPPRGHAPVQLALAVVVFALIVAAAVRLPWNRWPAWAATVPPLAYLVVVVLLRDASGGALSGLATLVALPVLWLALHGGRGSLVAASLGTGIVFAAPILAVGEPDYPMSDWRRAVLWVAVAGLVGPGVQALVRRMRDREARLVHLTTELIAIQQQWERFGKDLPDTVVLVVDADLRYQQVSGAGTLRESIEDWAGRTLHETSTAANVRLLEPLYRAALEGRPGSSDLFSSTDGAPHQVTVVPYDLHGEPAALVVAREIGSARQREIEALRAADELAAAAGRDPLTGLINRHTYDDLLVAHLNGCADPASGGPRGAVLVLDIDHLKRVNDALGHHVGDRLIVSVAQLLDNALRDTDVITRLGGDEFAVLLRDADAEVAARVAERLVDVVQRHTSGVPEITGAVTVSIGVKVIDDLMTSAHDLVVAADTAMYDAKNAGRDRFVVAP